MTQAKAYHYRQQIVDMSAISVYGMPRADPAFRWIAAVVIDANRR
jgi:hypothetical protein